MTIDELSGAKKAGTKHDAGKAPWHLMPWKAADQLVAVLGFGAGKYGPDNWRKVDNARDRYLSAAFRHLVAYARGEKIDPESKLPHLAHCMCSLAFMLEVDEELKASVLVPLPKGEAFSQSDKVTTRRCRYCKEGVRPVWVWSDSEPEVYLKCPACLATSVSSKDRMYVLREWNETMDKMEMSWTPTK